MNRRRIFAAVFFSVVILAVLGVIVGAEVVSSGQTVSVLRLRTEVVQGAPFSPSDVDLVQLRLAAGDINYETPGSVPPGSRYAISLQTGDLLRADDLVPGAAQIPITLTVTSPPPLTVGESVDIFANPPGSDVEVLIGHSLTIQEVSGTSLTVLVDSNDELAWLEIMADNSELKLYALAAVASPTSSMAPDDVAQAICELAPPDCSEPSPPPASVATGSSFPPSTSPHPASSMGASPSSSPYPGPPAPTPSP